VAGEPEMNEELVLVNQLEPVELGGVIRFVVGRNCSPTQSGDYTFVSIVGSGEDRLVGFAPWQSPAAGKPAKR
jgi:hypothetical protein